MQLVLMFLVLCNMLGLRCVETLPYYRCSSFFVFFCFCLLFRVRILYSLFVCGCQLWRNKDIYYLTSAGTLALVSVDAQRHYALLLLYHPIYNGKMASLVIFDPFAVAKLIVLMYTKS